MARSKVAAIDEQEAKALSWQDAIAEDEASASGIWRMENSALLDASTIMSLFYNEDWIFITCDLLASEFASPWPRVMKREIVDGRDIWTPAEGHPLQAVLDDPTIYGGAQQFWYRAAIFDALLGNCFFWWMGANKKFLIIPANEAQLKFDERTRMPSHLIWTGGEETASDMRAGVKFPMSEICHVQRPNPGSLWWGMSPFIPGRRSVLFNRYSQEFLNSFFEKGATPQMVVETEIGNSPDAIKTLAKSFEIAHGGRKNQRRPLVLPKGAKVNQINMTIADTQLQDLVNQNREVILNLLRIPKHALGLQTAGSLGSEEHKTALRFMWGSTVKPMLKRFSTTLTKFFQTKYLLSEGYVIDFDASEIEVANEDMARKAQLSQGLSGLFTINEIRRTIWEADPIEGGDIIPGILPPPQVVSSPLPLGLAAPRLSENGPSESPASPAQEVGLGDPLSQSSRQKYGPLDTLLGGVAYKAIGDAMDQEERDTAKKLEKIASELIINQIKDILALAKDMTKQKAKIDADELSLEAEKRLERWKTGFALDYMGALSSTIELGYESQLSAVFVPKDRQQLEALQEPTKTGRKAILARRGLDTFAQLTRTTTDRIVETIAAGVERGESLTSIAQTITEKFSQIIPSRARTIARTEALTAVSIGQQSAMKEASKIMPDAKKVWINAQDDRVRGNPGGLYPDAEVSHWEIHGDVVGINEKFSVDGVDMFLPRDPRVNKASAVINCRCRAVIVAAEDVGQITGGN